MAMRVSVLTLLLGGFCAFLLYAVVDHFHLVQLGLFLFYALLIDVFTKSECSSNNVVFQTPYIAEETAKPSPPKNHDLDSLNGNFLDSELKEENSYLLSFEDVKSNKCHPSEIDFSLPSWYSLYSLLYCRKDQFQKRQDCMFTKYKEYSIFFEFEVEMSLNRVH